MQTNSNRKTALYARVSSGHQQTGLEAQIRSLREFCARNNITNYLLYADENQSGVKYSRPALDKMMEGVRSGEIDRVVCYSFSRFARSVTHLLKALEEFKELDVAFTSVTEAIDTKSALGHALFIIISAVSQLERDILIERVRNGLANAKAKGVHIGRKKMRPSELIRNLYLKGVPYSEISRITGFSQGAIGSEAKVLKLELGPDKVTEMRRMARRRKVYAYKPAEPEINFPKAQASVTEDPSSNPIEIQTA